MNKQYDLTIGEIRDTNGNIAVKDYQTLVAYCQEIAKEFKAPTELRDNHELALAGLNQDNLTRFAKQIAQRRLKVVHAEMKQFEEQVKALEKIIKDTAKSYDEPIKAYMETHGLMPQYITYTITLKCGEDTNLKAYLDENKVKYETK